MTVMYHNPGGLDRLCLNLSLWVIVSWNIILYLNHCDSIVSFNAY